MTRALGCVFALFLAVAPAANDMCGIGCIQPVGPSCPHHPEEPAPAQPCGHDHSGIRAELVRAPLSAPTFVALATIAARAELTPDFSSGRPGISTDHSPPVSSSHTVILRI